MGEALAMISISWKTASSYRLQMAMSLATLMVAIVPIYYVGHALEPALGSRIVNEGGDTFGFLVLGIAILPLATNAATLLPRSIAGAIGSGTLESMLVTPVSLPSLVAGLTGYGTLFTLVRTLLAIGLGSLFGMPVSLQRVPAAALIVVLLVLAYLPVGLAASALVLRFRTEADLPRIATVSAMFLGGVYYPTEVIPSWLQRLSDFMPMTYGLRSLRQVLLQNVPLSNVVGDVTILAAMAGVAMLVGSLAFTSALTHVRRTGTLAQY